MGEIGGKPHQKFIYSHLKTTPSKKVSMLPNIVISVWSRRRAAWFAPT